MFQVFPITSLLLNVLLFCNGADRKFPVLLLYPEACDGRIAAPIPTPVDEVTEVRDLGSYYMDNDVECFKYSLSETLYIFYSSRDFYGFIEWRYSYFWVPCTWPLESLKNKGQMDSMDVDGDLSEFENNGEIGIQSMLLPNGTMITLYEYIAFEGASICLSMEDESAPFYFGIIHNPDYMLFLNISSPYSFKSVSSGCESNATSSVVTCTLSHSGSNTYNYGIKNCPIIQSIS